LEVPVYIYFPIVIALSHYMFKYLRFHSKSIRILKTHYFNEVISSERNDRARIFGALQKLEKEGRIKKIIERNSVFSFVDNLFFTRSNIYYVPINENKLYFRGYK